MDEIVPTAETVARLTALFRRNGYVRLPHRDQQALAPRTYKKGYEVRLVANSSEELEEVRRLLVAAGFVPGRAFGHARQWRQPLYGRDPVARFLAMVGWPPEA